MRFVSRKTLVLEMALVCWASPCAAQTGGPGLPPAQLTIDPGTIVTPVSPMLYGMMTEEINHSYDGGLYAELLQNRTFRTSWEGVEHWNLVRHGDSEAAMEIDRGSGPSQALPYSREAHRQRRDARRTRQASRTRDIGESRCKPHTTYHGSFYAKADDASMGPVTARLISDRTGAVLAEATVPLHSGDWSQYSFALTTGASSGFDAKSPGADSGSAGHGVDAARFADAADVS